MSEEYVLTRDIIYDHNERMLNIKKYYPFFKLSEISFRQYRDGRYDNLDMGYILMAVLRFFIEKNNFNEESVTYESYEKFMSELLRRDFDIRTDKEEEKEIISFIFDKIKNDGKPFVYSYFNPVDKKRQSVRTRIIDSKIVDGTVSYTISADAVEFYLDTKEIKDESDITIDQVLLAKLIASKNFRGGTEVVRRINSEVGKLIARKNEVLNILSYDVFQGVKAYEEFNRTGIRWFEEEQKLFVKNKELISQALKQGESENNYYSAMEDIYQLEQELNRAITRHGRLLRECTDLQVKADDIIARAKLGRLRTSFDFRDFLKNMINNNSVLPLENIVKPLFGIGIHKSFSLGSVDNMLTFKPDGNETGEKISSEEEEQYVYPDELEEERIKSNYGIFMESLFAKIISDKSFTLGEWVRELNDKTGYDVMKNADFYSFIVHLCQKKEYNLIQSVNRPDTFLEEIIKEHYMIEEERQLEMHEEVPELPDIVFSITSVTGSDEVIEKEGVACIANLRIESIE